jgi:hypothetical protein
MMEEPTIPNETRRKQLDELIGALSTAFDELDRLDYQTLGKHADDVDEAHGILLGLHDKAREERDSIPEWDRETVMDIVLTHVPSDGCDVERMDGEIVHRFEVGPHGDSTTVSYCVSVTNGKEYLIIDTPAGREEVWSN